MLSPLEALADDLRSALASHPDGGQRCVLLWLDPNSDFQRLVPHLDGPLVASGTHLLRYSLEEGAGQVTLKMLLLRLEGEAASAVVYLPGFGRGALEPPPDGGLPELWSVYEYRFKGAVWGIETSDATDAVPQPPTLSTWLQSHGIRFATEKTHRQLAQGGIDAPLARYAERRRNIDLADWPRPVRAGDVEAELGGDPRDALRALLAAPSNSLKDWESETPMVLAGIAARFGLAADGVDDPESLADSFALELALTEAWDAFGRPSDYPFSSRLPTRAEQRRQQLSFVRNDILSHTNLGPLFRQRVGRLEPNYDLSAWARGHTGQPAGLPLLARTRWNQFLERLNTAWADGWKRARDLLSAEREAIDAAAKASWVGSDTSLHWSAMCDLLALIDEAEAGQSAAASATAIAQLADGYMRDWWRADWLHLRLRAQASRAGLATLAQLADAAHVQYAQGAADRLTTLVEELPKWPPAGLASVDSLRAALWKFEPHRRQAVMIIDACRWDLAVALRDRLGPDCTVSAVASTLPSNTPFGMAALLPLAKPELLVDFGGGKATIRAEPGGPDLATRDGRKAFLQSTLRDPVSGAPLVDFLDLQPLLKNAKIPTTPVVVVFDNDLDEHGHKGVEQFPGLAEQFVESWARAIERLHDAGIGSVHLVTDHGFLLVPPDRVQALGTPELKPSQVLYKHVRWSALKPDAYAGEVVRVPLPASPDAVSLGIPRGLRTLVKPEPYLHGGLSLQECVIPHLVSQRALAQEQVGVAVMVTTNTLSSAPVPLVLRPAPKSGQAPLGGLRPTWVRVWVETVPPSGGVPTIAADALEQEVRADSGDQKPPLFIKEGLDLRAGQKLRLRAIDRDLGREIATLELTMLRDWE